MSLQAKINATILKKSEWIPSQIGTEINQNGQTDDRMFNESEDKDEFLIEEGDIVEDND